MERTGLRTATWTALLLVVLLVAACASNADQSAKPGPGSATRAPGPSGFLRIGSMGQIDSLNPFVSFNSDPITLFEYEYPFLLQYKTPELTFAPYFGTSWEQSADGKTWTFHTVPNVKWSDGQPLTAEDAAWTFSTILKYAKGPTANSAGYLLHMTKAVATDANTLVVTYEQPVANVLEQLSSIPILPEHVWSKYATGDGKGLKEYADIPENGNPVVSGGPFMMTQYKPNQVVTMEVNPNWYGQKPYITGFGLEYFATDDAAVQSLKTNQIDVIWQGVPTTAVDALRQAGMTVSITPATTFHELNINSNPKKTTNPELQDPAVRDAMSHAIDFDSIVKTAWDGYAQPGYSLIFPASGNAQGTDQPWTDPSLKPPTFDISLANQILDQAGYKIGPDGYRIANGHPMQYQVVFPHNELGAGMRMFQIIQADFKQIGIGITAQVLNDSAAWNAETKDHYTSYDMSIWDWGCSTDPDCILSVLTCDNWYTWNDAGYCNKEYDKLYSEQGTAIKVQDRLKIVYQMQQIVYRDKPFIVLMYEDNRVAWSPKWTGFSPSPQGEFSNYSLQSLLNAHLA